MRKLISPPLSLICFVFICSFYSLSQSPGSGYTVKFDGVNDVIYGGGNDLKTIVNNFTIEFWYNATGTITIQPEQNGLWNSSGISGTGQRYAVFPYHGMTPAGVPGQAGVGVSIGTNAIQVYEHSTLYLPTLLSYSGPLILSGWNHIAIVYINKRPYLYLNGMFAKAGLTSNQVSVFPSALLGGWAYGFFEGDIDEFRVWSVSKTPAEIRDNMCQKLIGNEANLARYYRLDEGSGLISTDETGNYNGDLMGAMSNANWLISSAPIGDESVHDYSVSTSSVLNIASAHGDDLSAYVFNLTTAPSSIHLYRVDEEPNTTTPPGSLTQLSQVVYYGMKVFGGTGVNCTVQYNYDGHPGILDENMLETAIRDHNADMTWSQTNASLDIVNNTLTHYNQTSSEYILASNYLDPLPIELTYFKATLVNNDYVKLEWETSSEINNDYFTVERSTDGITWEPLIKVEGKGNSSSKTNYVTNDMKPYWNLSYYRLKQTDFDGQFEYSNINTINFVRGNGYLTVAPNPFKTSITIEGSPSDLEELSIHNALGQNVTGRIAVIKKNLKERVWNVSSLETGVYYISTNARVLKVVKQ
ncbi:MAG: T9SS type A sorting domain-containing protein [Crocinitomicaceae bacterium]|nr:T9SS type A sorting domain-containing protein [Crocinitomicaceae bacterium]